MEIFDLILVYIVYINVLVYIYHTGRGGRLTTQCWGDEIGLG